MHVVHGVPGGVFAKSVLKAAQEPISLDRPIGESEDGFFGDFIEDDGVESPVNAATSPSSANFAA